MEEVPRHLYAVVRPHPGLRGQGIFEFLAEMGFSGDGALVLPPGTPDGEAAVWVGRLEVELVVMPFHVHRDRHGDYVDGTGVAALLSGHWARRNVPILMPVSRFSWSARFPRRLEELRDRRPDVARLVVPMQEAEQESETGNQRLRDALLAIRSGEGAPDADQPR